MKRLVRFLRKVWHVASWTWLVSSVGVWFVLAKNADYLDQHKLVSLLISVLIFVVNMTAMGGVIDSMTPKRCFFCAGTGWRTEGAWGVPRAEPYVCEDCGGSGFEPAEPIDFTKTFW